MTRLYLHGLTDEGPFRLRNYIDTGSLSWPVLRRYDVVGPGTDEQPELWSSPWITRATFEYIKDILEREGKVFISRPFGYRVKLPPDRHC